MQEIYEIIYNKTISNKILHYKDIENILEIEITNKCLSEYIKTLKVNQESCNNLAYYSYQTKNITIYSYTIKKMILNIERKFNNIDEVELKLYINLSILQVLLHEIEHANQRKIAYKDNTLEALIIRLSNMIDNDSYDKFYKYCPDERLAEIKSYQEICDIIKNADKKKKLIYTLIKRDELKSKIRGYYCKNNSINIPIVDFYKYVTGINQSTENESLNKLVEKYSLCERFKYGFPISISEYKTSKLTLQTMSVRIFKS